LNGQDGKGKCLEGSLGHAAALTELDESKLVFSSSGDSGLYLYSSCPGPVALEGGRMNLQRQNATCCSLLPWGALQAMALKAPNYGCSLERMIACRHFPVPVLSGMFLLLIDGNDYNIPRPTDAILLI